MMKTKPSAISQVLYLVLMIVLALIFLFPVVWMLSASFRPDQYVMYQLGSWRTLLPIPFTWHNYRNVFTQEPFGRFIATSVAYVAIIIPFNLLFSGMAGYALSRLRFPGRQLFTAIVISLIIIPAESTLLPLYLEMTKFGWINTYYVMIVPFLANPLYIFLLRQFFLSLPRELEESAVMDGAGVVRIFWQIVVPNSKPVFFTAGFLLFLDRWNDFLWPFIAVTDKKYWTVQIGLQSFFSQFNNQWGSVMAASVVATIPVYILFVFFQRYLVEGIAHSGLK